MKLLLSAILILWTLSGCVNNSLLSQHEGAARANLNLGLAYLDSNERVEAKDKLLLATRLAPHDPWVWSALAYFEEFAGEDLLAEKYYKKALHLCPHEGALHNNWGAFLCRHQHYQEGIKQLLIAAEDPNYLDPRKAYLNAAHCARLSGDRRQAEIFRQKADRRSL